MEYIRGKFKQMIFESDNGYKVGLFRVKEASGEMEEYINKTITFTGYFADIDAEAYYKLTGNYVFNERYGNQYQVSSYEREEPKGKDAVISFLSITFISLSKSYFSPNSGIVTGIFIPSCIFCFKTFCSAGESSNLFDVITIPPF